jgi:diguanylate cyclase (GGDEF)-like protein
MHTLPPEFALAVLDGLDSHIAVLEDSGRIIAVNRAWRSFAEANGGSDSGCFIGSNYFAVCDTAARTDALAAAVLEGIQTVREGRQDVFTLEYPCDSPTAERWFILRITRCTAAGRVYLIVAHSDITERVRAERTIRETKHAVDAANRALRLALKREQRMARTDDLTGAHNRRHFFELGERLFELARRYAQPLSLILLDIDRFKTINDSHGHEVGDAVLVHVVEVMKTHLRGVDLFARIGGEEFAVLLPQTDTARALHVAERLRKDLARRVVEVGGTRLQVTVSAGVATLEAADQDLESLLRRADAGLYAAKESGRDRICVPEAA